MSNDSVNSPNPTKPTKNIYKLSTNLQSNLGPVMILANEINISIVSQNIFLTNERIIVSDILSTLEYIQKNPKTMLYPITKEVGIYNVQEGNYVCFWPSTQPDTNPPMFEGLAINKLITFFKSLLARLDFLDSYNEIRLRPYVNYGSDAIGVPSEPVLVPEIQKVERISDNIMDLDLLSGMNCDNITMI